LSLPPLPRDLGSEEEQIKFYVHLEDIRPGCLELPSPAIVGHPRFRTSSSRVHERIRNSQPCIIKECGHAPMIEQPDEFNRSVLGFLWTVDLW
jgi:pimeloyl-ACP methyl ester carboxylesterase